MSGKSDGNGPHGSKRTLGDSSPNDPSPKNNKKKQKRLKDKEKIAQLQDEIRILKESQKNMDNFDQDNLNNSIVSTQESETSVDSTIDDLNGILSTQNAKYIELLNQSSGPNQDNTIITHIVNNNRINTNEIPRQTKISENNKLQNGLILKPKYNFVVKLQGIDKNLTLSSIIKGITDLKGNNLVVENSFFNKHNGLFYILTNDKDTFERLSENWPLNAFGKGVKVINNIDQDTLVKENKKKRFFISIRGVEVNIDVIQDEDFKKSFEANGIMNVTRILKKYGNENKALPILKAEVDGEDNFKKLMEQRSVKVLWTKYKIEEWHFDNSRPIQCYKCLQYGHHQNKCKREHQICLKCGEKHSYKLCDKEKDFTKCSNCGKNHSAVSKNCEINKTNSIKTIKDNLNRDYSKINPNILFSHVASNKQSSPNKIIIQSIVSLINLLNIPNKQSIIKITNDLKALVLE